MAATDGIIFARDPIDMGQYPQYLQHPSEVEATGTEDLQHEASAEKRVGGTPLPNQLKTEWGQPHMDQPGIALLNEQYRKLLEGIRKEGEHFELTNASFVHLLDTGGQPSFQDVLPLLLDVPCTYIQVFNAALSLDEPVPITYRPNDCDRHSIPLQGEDGRNMMLRSFSSMQTMAQKCSKQLASFLQEGSPVPQLRLFVVSTVERCLSVSTEDVLGSQFRGELTRGFRCHCTEEIAPHLALPPKQGQSLKCSQKRGRQAYSNQQRIWFSEVSKVEVSWRC